MKFEWDEKKAASNLRKHSVSFEKAIFIFDDPFALRIDDERHSSPSEVRTWQIGETDEHDVLVVVFTIRGTEAEKRYRLISARKANKRERALYELNKRIPIS